MLRAVVRFARDIAKLPSFPRARRAHECIDETRSDADSDDEDEFPSLGAVIQLVATDKVPGQVLPRAQEVWLALLPFQDLGRKVPEHVQFDLIQKRRTFLDVLVRLAQSDAFRWAADKLHCGEAVGPKTDNSFWLDLLRALSPRAMHDETLELERNLIALSRARRPRFLLCFANDISGVDFAGLLDEFLFTSDDDIAELEGAYMKEALDVLDVDDWDDVEVEIGLSFTKGKVSHAAMASLVDVLDRLHTKESGGIRFRVTTLRFGAECTFQAKALELLGQYRLRPTCTVKSIRLGTLTDVKVIAKSDIFAQLVRGFGYLESLSVSTFESFEALASAARYGGASLLQGVDVRYSATTLHAAWLAFAFFHVDSRSTVSSVCLRLPRCKRDAVPMVLTSEWIAAFMRTLQSSRAEIDLAGIEGGGALPQMTKSGQQTREFVRLQPGANAKAAPVNGAKSVCNLGRKDLEYEVLIRYKSAAAIIIPGVGLGWIPLSAIVSERVETSKLVSDSAIKTNDRITSFVWDGTTVESEGDADTDATHADLLVELLAIIGEPLRTLYLPASGLTTPQLEQVLRFCPNLTHLNICGHNLLDLQPFEDAYASGQCRISSLSIAKSEHRQYDSTRALSAMTKILEGKGKSVLRELIVDLQCSNSSTTHAHLDAVSSFAKAMSSSPSMQYLHLACSVEQLNNHLIRFPVDFGSNPFSYAPMRLSSKLAFLSVMYHYRDQRSMSRLDSSVLATIFTFGQDGVPRRVLRNASMTIDKCSCALCEAIPRAKRIRP